MLGFHSNANNASHANTMDAMQVLLLHSLRTWHEKKNTINASNKHKCCPPFLLAAGLCEKYNRFYSCILLCKDCLRLRTVLLFLACVVFLHLLHFLHTVYCACVLFLMQGLACIACVWMETTLYLRACKTLLINCFPCFSGLMRFLDIDSLLYWFPHIEQNYMKCLKFIYCSRIHDYTAATTRLLFLLCLHLSFAFIGINSCIVLCWDAAYCVQWCACFISLSNILFPWSVHDIESILLSLLSTHLNHI